MCMLNLYYVIWSRSYIINSIIEFISHTILLILAYQTYTLSHQSEKSKQKSNIKTVNKKISKKQNQNKIQMHQPSTINIVLTLPTLPSEQYIQIHTTSPIKQFAYARAIEDVAHDYYSLFVDARRDGEEGKSSPSCLRRRRLNLGEKVRNKLESTNNKSESLKYEGHGHISTFESRSSQEPCSSYSNQSKNQYLQPDHCKFLQNLSASFYSLRSPMEASRGAYESYHQVHQKQQNQCQQIQTNPFQWETGTNNNIIKKQQEASNQKQLIQGISSIPMETSSLHSSPYNNFSAKTENSPDSMLNQGKKQVSPINILKASDSQELPSCKIKLLNFNDQSEIERQESGYQSQVPEIKVTSPQPAHEVDQFVGSIKIVSSRVIDRPYFGTIENIESRCIPCDEPITPTWQNSYQYALHQLNQLKQNVTILQLSTSNLLSLKCPIQQFEPSPSQIPSSINKQQNAHKLDESFIFQLENNFNDILDTQRKQNDAESLLIGQDSRKDLLIQQNEQQQQNIYRTPNHYTNMQGSINEGNALSQCLHQQWKNRQISISNKELRRVFVKNNEYYDLRKLLNKENMQI